MALNVLKEYLVSIGFSTDNKSFQDTHKKFQTLGKTLQKFADQLNEASGFKELQKTITDFSKKAADTLGNLFGKVLKHPLGLFAVALTAVNAGLTKLAFDMAAADMQAQIFARRLLTTTANARSLQAVMKAMNLSSLEQLQDIAINPELRAQFLSLRQTAAALKVSEGAQEGFRNVRALGFEFQRFGLIVNFTLQNLGGSFAKMNEGPIKFLTSIVLGFNQFLVANGDKATSVFLRLVTVINKFAVIAARIFLPTAKLFNKNAIASIGNVLYKTFDLFLTVLEEIAIVLDALLTNFNKLENSAFFRFLSKLFTAGIQFIQKIGQVVSNFTKGFFPGAGGQSSPGEEKPFNENKPTGTRSINQFLKDFRKRSGLDFTVTSTTGGKHAAGSAHYQGRAADIVPKDTSAAGYVDAIKKLLMMPGLEKINVEVLLGKYQQIVGMLKSQNIPTDKLTRQVTKDWTGEHLHTQIRPVVNINVNGAQDPKKVAEEVNNVLSQNWMNNMFATQGSIA